MFVFYIVCFLLVAPHGSYGGTSSLWNELNCSNGSVIDAVCCEDSHCPKLSSEKDCNNADGSTCLWDSEKDKCVQNRDARNNVCCLNAGGEMCMAVSRGICPPDNEVPSGCCSRMGAKWDGILSVNRTGYVCCNTPCRDMEKLGCEVPPRCHERSHKGWDYGRLGFKSGLLDSYLKGPYPTHIGQVVPGLIAPPHLLGGYGEEYKGEFPGQGLHDYDDSEDKHVEEITVDDLMNSLIEALSADDDVYSYNKVVTSDPLFKKDEFGGVVDSFNYIDPNYFLDAIYGTPKTYGGGPRHGHSAYVGYGGGYGTGYGSLAYGGNNYGHSTHAAGSYGHSAYGAGDYGSSDYGGGPGYDAGYVASGYASKIYSNPYGSLNHGVGYGPSNQFVTGYGASGYNNGYGGSSYSSGNGASAYNNGYGGSLYSSGNGASGHGDGYGGSLYGPGYGTSGTNHGSGYESASYGTTYDAGHKTNYADTSYGSPYVTSDPIINHGASGYDAKYGTAGYNVGYGSSIQGGGYGSNHILSNPGYAHVGNAYEPQYVSNDISQTGYATQSSYNHKSGYESHSGSDGGYASSADGYQQAGWGTGSESGYESSTNEYPAVSSEYSSGNTYGVNKGGGSYSAGGWNYNTNQNYQHGIVDSYSQANLPNFNIPLHFGEIHTEAWRSGQKNTQEKDSDSSKSETKKSETT